MTLDITLACRDFNGEAFWNDTIVSKSIPESYSNPVFFHPFVLDSCPNYNFIIATCGLLLNIGKLVNAVSILVKLLLYLNM